MSVIENLTQFPYLRSITTNFTYYPTYGSPMPMRRNLVQCSLLYDTTISNIYALNDTFNGSGNTGSFVGAIGTTVSNPSGNELEVSSTTVYPVITSTISTTTGKEYTVSADLNGMTSSPGYTASVLCEVIESGVTVASQSTTAPGNFNFTYTAGAGSASVRYTFVLTPNPGPPPPPPMAPFSFNLDNALVYFIDTAISSETVCVSKNGYRYGFNGMEKAINSSNYDYGSRFFNSNLSRFIKIDKFSFKFISESNYSYASNNPIACIDMGGDSTYLIIVGAGYVNYSSSRHNLGNGFMLNAIALKKKIESSIGFDSIRDKVEIVYAPNVARFVAATNKIYTTGPIASLTVFSHGFGYSSTNGTNTGGISLGGEMPGEVRPDGTIVTKKEAEDQKSNYDLREINGNTIGLISKTNFAINARIVFYGCNIGGGKSWNQYQIDNYSFAQRVSNILELKVYAFTGPARFKQDKDGKLIFDGEMIREIDKSNQVVNLSEFNPNSSAKIP